MSSPVPVDVLTTSDLASGTIIALALAFTASSLQGTTNQENFVLWKMGANATQSNHASGKTNTVVFDEEDWKEASRPDNYVLYNTRIKQKSMAKVESKQKMTMPTEQKWVLLALLVLFVPLFSIEFFFALSRQMICGGGGTGDMFLSQSSAVAQYLCAPAPIE